MGSFKKWFSFLGICLFPKPIGAIHFLMICGWFLFDIKFDSGIEFLFHIESFFNIEFHSHIEFNSDNEFDPDIEFDLDIEFLLDIEILFDLEFDFDIGSSLKPIDSHWFKHVLLDLFSPQLCIFFFHKTIKFYLMKRTSLIFFSQIDTICVVKTQ